MLTLQHLETGETVKLSSIAAFCQVRGYPRPAGFYDLAAGRKPSYKGWVVLHQLSRPVYLLADPQGNEHKVASFTEFATEHNLDISNLRKLCVGQLKKYRGWTKPEITSEPTL